jgi:ABC-type multidrug transport system ATPase subunit
MTISLIDAGKRYNREWIFRHVDLEFFKDKSYAITGSNGSGKSTFLQTLAGMLNVSEGKITYEGWEADKVYAQISFCAPYSEVIEEMTLVEFLNFHNGFKSFLPGTDINSIISHIGLSHAADKQIRYYSSGMKQRVRLAQAVFSDTPVLMLDEPTSNFDEEGISLYLSLIDQYAKQRLVIVCSNDRKEYSFCDEVLRMEDLKNIESRIKRGTSKQQRIVE